MLIKQLFYTGGYGSAYLLYETITFELLKRIKGMFLSTRFLGFDNMGSLFYYFNTSQHVYISREDL